MINVLSFGSLKQLHSISSSSIITKKFGIKGGLFIERAAEVAFAEFKE
jgi:hypothetical protein